jgi:hypothetical protein
MFDDAHSVKQHGSVKKDPRTGSRQSGAERSDRHRGWFSFAGERLIPRFFQVRGTLEHHALSIAARATGWPGPKFGSGSYFVRQAGRFPNACGNLIR